MIVKNDHRSKFSNLSNWKEEAWKKSGLQRDSNPWPPRIPVRCSTNWAMKPTTAVHIWIISYKLHIISLLTGRYELNKLTSLPTCGFIAQLVEHRTGIRGGHGFESRWSPDFFRLLLSNCLNCKIYCDDHSSLSLHGFITHQQNEHLPVGLLAQLVKHCTRRYRRGHGFDVQAWIIYQALFSPLLN